jgi:hypothetical protein
MLEQRKSVFMAIDEELIFTKNVNLQSLNHKSLFFQKLLPKEFRTSIDDPLCPNVFRQYGSSWQMRFQGSEAVFLNRQKGAEYITALLTKPHKSISVLDLYDNGMMDKQTRIALKAGGFKVADYQHIGKLRDALKNLDREIAEAEEFNDHQRVDILRVEKEQILKQVNAMIAPGGKVRKSDDPLKRPRDAVSKAIRRTIQNIRKAQMNRLADHLGNGIIFGNEMMYNPYDEIFWETKLFKKQ